MHFCPCTATDLRSSGFAAVDGLGAVALPVPTNLPLLLPEQLPPTGTGHANRFVSEMGAVGMPSFESLAPSLNPERWALHAGQPAATCAKKRCIGSNVMARRNFPCDSLILAYFGKTLRLASGGGQGWFTTRSQQPSAGPPRTTPSNRCWSSRSDTRLGLPIRITFPGLKSP